MKTLLFAALLLLTSFHEIECSLSQFIDHCAKEYSIPRAIIVGVATHETSLGTTGIGTPEKSNNLFGIKKGDGWTGDWYSPNGTTKWRSYCTRQESVLDFCKFVNKHYPHLIGKPIERWQLWGYGPAKYEQKGFFKQFENR